MTGLLDSRSEAGIINIVFFIVLSGTEIFMQFLASLLSDRDMSETVNIMLPSP